NLSFGIHIRGPLDGDVLRQALQALTTRHETLRTTFTTQGGLPVQAIAAAAPAVELPPFDLSDRRAGERDAEVTALAQEQARLAFDLGKGPLWRVALLRLAADEHLLLVTMCHIIGDEWSMTVVAEDLARLYAAALGRGLAQPPALPVQY